LADGGVLDRLNVRGDIGQQRRIERRRRVDGGFWQSGCRRDLTDAKGDICDQLRARLFVQFGDERRLQERQLLQPDGVPDDQVEFFEPNMSGPRVRSDRFADNVPPLLLETKFEEVRLQSETFGQAGQDGAERIK
jgi:hypothetical protein